MNSTLAHGCFYWRSSFLEYTPHLEEDEKRGKIGAKEIGRAWGHDSLRVP